jgi:hypothetical protein
MYHRQPRTEHSHSCIRDLLNACCHTQSPQVMSQPAPVYAPVPQVMPMPVAHPQPGPIPIMQPQSQPYPVPSATYGMRR